MSGTIYLCPDADYWRTLKSVPPLAVVEPKGKALETPSANPKKRKLVKASKTGPKI